MYRITIPEWTDKSGQRKPRRSFNAELVETLLANSPQPSDLIFRYYGEQAPASAFKPGVHDRLVFKDGDNYTIIPNIPRNSHMWAKLNAST